MIKQYLKVTVRNFISNPAINLINLAGLTISMALVIILSAYCYSEFTADHFHKNTDRIYLYPRTEKFINTSALLKEQIDLSVPSIDLTVRVGDNWEPSTFQVDGSEPFNFDLFFADNEFFDIFNYKPLVGNLDDALKNPLTLVVTKSFAEKLLGTTDVIGKTVKFNNNQLFTIEAVIEPPLENSVFSFDAVTSVATKQIVYPNSEENSNWGWTAFLTFIRVKEGVKPINALKSIASSLPENAKKLGYNSIQLIPLKKLYFSSYKYSFLHFGNKKQVMTFALAGMLILIIALVNYINISTSNWEEKIRQTGVRKVIGAKRTTIFLSLISESFLFFIAGLLIASFLAFILSAVLTNYTGIHFNQNLLLTGKSFYFFGGGIILLSVLFSLLPAIRISSSNAIDNLKNKLNTRNKKSYARAFMVTGQFIIAIVLIAFTILVKKQINFGSSNLGINQENIVGIKLTKQLQNKKEVLRKALQENSAIEEISFTQYYPNNTVESWSMDNVVKGEKKHFEFNAFEADANFLDILGLQAIQGRLYSNDLETDKNKAVVNEAFVREHNLENPIGEKIQLMTGECEIVGVVKDFHYKSVNEPIAPLIVQNKADASFCLVKLGSSRFNNLHHNIQFIKAEVNELSPSFPVEISFFDQAVENMYQSELQFRKTFTLFAGSAIIICCMGIFAMSLFASQKRTKEIGIRKVNGAKISEILSMLNKDFIKWVAIAFVIATPIAYYAMNKWLENFAYKTSLSWWIFALAGLLVLGIALLTVSWQSWRAATRNPVEALRYE